MNSPSPPPAPAQTAITAAQTARIAQKRHARNTWLRRCGLAGILLSISLIVILFGAVLTIGLSAFWQTRILLELDLSIERIDPDQTGDAQIISKANYRAIVQEAIVEKAQQVTGALSRQDRRAIRALVSKIAPYLVRDQVLDNRALIGTRAALWLPANNDVDAWVKGKIRRDIEESRRPINALQARVIDDLMATGRLDRFFNTDFFTRAASSYPEVSGLASAMVGSLMMVLIVVALALPLGVAAAIYLEEFARPSRWVSLIEININNLAAVPSIVFGVLGLAVFINWFHLPRSTPIVGGLVLTLMTLPTIIIAARAALQAVPHSIRQAAFGLGASKVQTVFHHVLPVAIPGIITGLIIGITQAVGETAPLIMIGMAAFIPEASFDPLSPATALPVQVYMLAGLPGRGYTELAGATIILLLVLVLSLNSLAAFLRHRFQKRL
ncbi:MAG: phosphate ABC transporter permease PstA [Pseudomonadota bacterium]